MATLYILTVLRDICQGRPYEHVGRASLGPDPPSLFVIIGRNPKIQVNSDSFCGRLITDGMTGVFGFYKT